MKPSALIYLPLFLLMFISSSCGKKKKPTLSGDDPVAIDDFIGFFPEASVPYDASDSVLRKKEKDSLLVSFANFSTFVPDSVVKKLFGKSTMVKIYADARIPLKGGGNFLIVRTVAGTAKKIILLAYDQKDIYADQLTVLQPDQLSNTTQGFRIDRQYGIMKTITRKNADGSINDGRDVYAIDTDTKKFGLVMTDALDEKITELVNPIDTMKRTHKYAADYSNGKMNLVSVRDGRRGDRILFFVHIDKNKGACSGELKGEAIFTKPNIAEYRQGGDPCVLQFIFSNSAVTLKELEGCGARRGLDCTFNGSFAKKKNPTPAKKGK